MTNPIVQARHRIEYRIFTTALGIVDRMSTDRALALGRRIGDIAFALSFIRKHVAIRNILQSGITSSRREATRIAHESFRHFALLAIESIKVEPYFTGEQWRQIVDIEIDDDSMAALTDPGKGLILVSGHIGNWEVASRILATYKPVVGITKNMNNPLTDQVVKARKCRSGFSMTPKRDADARRLMQVLKDGKVLGLLYDQHARIAYGEPVKFFGRYVSMHKSPALLHLVSGAPLCVGYCVRTGPMRFKVKTFPPIRHSQQGSRNADIRSIMLALNDMLEQMVREYPEQYLWVHRRWRRLRRQMLDKIERISDSEEGA
jgi:KDO2-lipid IV(A) lauroyltransferase